MMQIKLNVADVTQLEMIAKLERFATLASRYDFSSVTTISQTNHTCHIRHNKSYIENSEISTQNRLTIKWLTIVLDEGHIEPSQPCIGKLIGWPCRLMPKRTLWIDFVCWLRRNKFSEYNLEETYFHEIVSKVFKDSGNLYEFPSLETCRETFKSLKATYECD